MLTRQVPKGRQLPVVAGGAALVLAAIAVRVTLFDQISGDYTAFVSPWYDFLATHHGFAALRYDFANYNPPYLYLLTFATAVPIPKLVAVKMISVLFDLLMAWYAYLVVDLRRAGPIRPACCAAGVLFAPSVVVNSGAWAQCDSIYTAFCLGSLYFLLREKPWWSSIFFGVALSFKLQAVFFLPVLVIVFVVRARGMARDSPRRAGRWWGPVSLLAVPLVFLLLLLPAVAAGRSLGSLLDIYPAQVSSGGQITGGSIDLEDGQGLPGSGTGGGARPQGQDQGFTRSGPPGGVNERPAAPGGSTERPGSFTYDAANFYQWIGRDAPAVWKDLGFGLTALALVVLGLTCLLRRERLDMTGVVMLSATVLLVVPFLLPEMHERYFYLADVCCILLAGYVPRLTWAAVGTTLCSLATYAPFLWNTTPVDLKTVAAVQLLVVLGVTGAFFVRMLRPRWEPSSRSVVGGRSPQHPAPIR